MALDVDSEVSIIWTVECYHLSLSKHTNLSYFILGISDANEPKTISPLSCSLTQSGQYQGVLMLAQVFISVILLLLSINVLHASEPVQNTLFPFTSDGCSIVPDGTFNNPAKWQMCCVQHDIAYWLGGTKEDRKAADKALGSCIGKNQNKIIGNIYYLGVRIGGVPNSNMGYRWGYGWKYNREYKPLSTYEVAQAAELVPNNLSSVVISKLKSNLEPFPSLSGNYCMDEITRALHREYGDSLLRIVSYDKNNNTVLFKTNNCDKIWVARFNAHNLGLCTENYYSDSESQLLQFIHAPKNCGYKQ